MGEVETEKASEAMTLRLSIEDMAQIDGIASERGKGNGGRHSRQSVVESFVKRCLKDRQRPR